MSFEEKRSDADERNQLKHWWRGGGALNQSTGLVFHVCSPQRFNRAPHCRAESIRNRHLVKYSEGKAWKINAHFLCERYDTDLVAGFRPRQGGKPFPVGHRCRALSLLRPRPQRFAASLSRFHQNSCVLIGEELETGTSSVSWQTHATVYQVNTH